MIHQKRSSTLRTASSLLVSFFFGILTIIGLLPDAVYADPPTDQTGDAQLNEDTDPPVITTNLNNDQVLMGTVPIVETIYENNPQEYSIKVTSADGAELVVNGVPVGVTQNPASGDELRFDWDTTLVANGIYQVVLSARDQSGNSQSLPVQVTVDNQPSPPAYPPITSELTPIPEQAVTPPRKLAPPKVTPPTGSSRPTDILGAKTSDDQLAQHLQNTAAVTPEPQQQAGDVCATFFGVCWYYSVPATVVMSAAAFGFYRFRNRVEA